MKRRLPTHEAWPMDHAFASEYAILNPASRARDLRAAWTEGMWSAAIFTAAIVWTVTSMVAGLTVPEATISRHDGNGAIVAVGAIAGAVTLIAMIAPRLWRRHRMDVDDHVVEVAVDGWLGSTSWDKGTFERFTDLNEARTQIRELALDTHGHLISDDALTSVETIRFAAAVAAREQARLQWRAEHIGGRGNEADAMRQRILTDADAAGALCEQHVQLVEALRDAAYEMYAAFDALGDEHLIELAARADRDAAAIDEARGHIERMRALALAAQDLAGPVDILADVAAAAEQARAATPATSPDERGTVATAN